MKLRKVNGAIYVDKLGGMFDTKLVVRTENAGGYRTLSIADERAGIMLQVNFEDIKDMLKK